jgi:hypothetical protein
MNARKSSVLFEKQSEPVPEGSQAAVGLALPLSEVVNGCVSQWR